MSVHLFILYWGMLSFITPPVALGAFAAASIAGASPLATGFKAMRLGSVIYFIPFFFVLNPALILVGSWVEILLATVTVVAGVIFLAGGLQGYIPGLGHFDKEGVAGSLGRSMLCLGGGLVALPGLQSIGIEITDTQLLLAGTVTAAAGYFLSRRTATVQA